MFKNLKHSKAHPKKHYTYKKSVYTNFFGNIETSYARSYLIFTPLKILNTSFKQGVEDNFRSDCKVHCTKLNYTEKVEEVT